MAMKTSFLESDSETTLKDSFAADDGVTALDEHFIFSLYDPERRPFTNFDPLVSPVSHLRMQEFLERNGLRTTQAKPRSQEALHIHMCQLQAVQNAERARLERSTWGVHNAIAMLMREEKQGDEVTKNKNLLTGVLIPEWREHLDDFVDCNDVLVWFDMSMRRGTQFEEDYDRYMSQRRTKIHEMVTFLVQRLQSVNEEVEIIQPKSNGRYRDCKSDIAGTSRLATGSHLFSDIDDSSPDDSDNESLYPLSSVTSDSDESLACSRLATGSHLFSDIDSSSSPDDSDNESLYPLSSVTSDSDESLACSTHCVWGSDSECSTGSSGSSLSLVHVHCHTHANDGPSFIFPKL